MIRLTFLAIWLLVCTPALMTQVVASQLAYARWLGAPLFLHVYNPYLFPLWLWKYSWYYKLPFQKALVLGAACAGIGIVAALLLRLWNPSTTRSIYGNHTWATERDIRKAHLRAKDGPIVGEL